MQARCQQQHASTRRCSQEAAQPDDSKRQTVDIKFGAFVPGRKEYSLLVMSDCWIGADVVVPVRLKVTQKIVLLCRACLPFRTLSLTLSQLLPLYGMCLALFHGFDSNANQSESPSNCTGHRAQPGREGGPRRPQCSRHRPRRGGQPRRCLADALPPPRYAEPSPSVAGASPSPPATLAAFLTMQPASRRGRGDVHG
jgi:hypothetical protein